MVCDMFAWSMQTNQSKMDKEKKNEELISRRGFFRKAAASALPILAATTILSNPALAKAVEKPLEVGTDAPSGQCSYSSCSYSCSGGCSGGCSSSCGYSCSGSCKSGCGGCKGAVAVAKGIINPLSLL